MHAGEFDEALFFRAIEQAGVRCLLIGRRALIVLGLPVMTADYDLWIHSEDAALLNEAVKEFDLFPNRTVEEARNAGRYVLENDEHVDVLLSKTRSTVDGVALAFDDAFARRQAIALGKGATVHVPCLDDLILTKRFASRPKDAEDVRLLETLRRSGAG